MYIYDVYMWVNYKDTKCYRDIFYGSANTLFILFNHTEDPGFEILIVKWWVQLMWLTMNLCLT